MPNPAVKLCTAAALLAIALATLACSTPKASGAGEVSTSEQQAQSLSPSELRQFIDSPIIPLGDSPILGDVNAPIVIVEFVSMQCPFCARSSETTRALLAKYPEQVQLVFKHMPLYFQPQARDAARMLEAAHQQNAFWEMQEGFFDRLADLQTLGALNLGLEIAQELGLDPEHLITDFAEPMHEKIIQQDLALAEKLGVSGTPFFFINGIAIQGAQPIAAFEEAIALAMAKQIELQEEGVAQDYHYAASVEFFIEQQARANQEAAAQADDTPPAVFIEIEDQDLIYGEKEEFLVTLVEFSSLQCPFCARASSTMRELLDEYGDQVRFVFKHKPLPMHSRSIPAGKAVIAAEQQGKGMAMLHQIYDNQSRLNEEGIFEEFARSLALDMDEFRAAFAAAETGAQIEADHEFGESIGVRGTPTFFINGTKIIGAQPKEVFAAQIEAELERARELQEEQGLQGEELYQALVEEK